MSLQKILGVEMQPRKMQWRLTITSLVGALLAGLGAALAICWEDIFFSILKNELKLTPRSRGFEIWREPPIPMYLDFYFFNWTNPEDINDATIKPRVVEMGPYRFRETKEKVNISWHDNFTISYRQLRRWYYDESESNGDLDDNVTTVNAIAASAVYSSRFGNYFTLQGLSLGLKAFEQKIYVTKSVRELLFDGYEDPLLDLANSLPQSMTNAPRIEKFGWFFKRNGSIENDGYFNMATGTDTIDRFGVLAQWNNVSVTPYYPGECGNITGSAGEFFPPKVSKNGQISLFSPDLCRTISFDYDEVVDIETIKAYKFSSGVSILDNGTEYESNKCFCTGECQPSGLLNVSSCRYGSPAFVSLPHFYQADPFYTDAVEGLTPNKDKHNFYLALEPTSGIPLDVAARLQLNILISPNKNVEIFKNVQKVFLPILWFEQHVTVGGDIASSVQLMLSVPFIGTTVSLTIFVIGIIILLWTPVRINIKALIKSRRKEKTPKEKNSKRIVLNNMREPRENVCMLPDVQETASIEAKSDSDEEKVHESLTMINDISKKD